MARDPATQKGEKDLKAVSRRLREETAIPEDQVKVLESLVSQLHHLEREVEPDKRATVKSAVPLTPSERSELEKKLTGHFGDGLLLRWEVDPSLLGGIVVRVGDKIIDGSVAGKLEALKRSLKPKR